MTDPSEDTPADPAAQSNDFSRGLPTSSVVYRVAGRTYPLKVVRNCVVCRSPYRIYIENALLKGHTYTSIADGLPEDCRVKATHIGAHYRNRHMPLEEHARREIIERQAKQLNLSVVEGDRVLTHHAFLQGLVGDVQERIATREIEPSIAEGLKAAALLERMQEVEDSEGELENFRTAIRILMQTARAVMDGDQYQVYSQRLLSDPTLSAMMSGQSRPVVAEVSDNGDGGFQPSMAPALGGLIS